MFASLRRFRWARGPRWVAAGLCLVLAAASALPSRRVERRVHTVLTVVAGRALAPGQLLTSHDIAVARWPANLRPDGAFARSRQVIGERLAGAVARGEPVTIRRLVGSHLTDGLPAGLVAADATLAGDRRALLHPGDRVDLLALPRPDVGGAVATPARRPPRSEVVVEHALVLAVYAGTTYASADPATDVVLAATPKQATEIAELTDSSQFAAVAVPP